MPFSNVIGITPDDLTTVVSYLESTKHAHHEEYRLTPLEICGVASKEEFISSAILGFGKNAAKGRGRPPKNAVSWYVVRMPDYTRLTEGERREYLDAILEEAAHGQKIAAVMNSHINRLFHSEDINLLVSCFDSRGCLVRDRNSDPIKSLRRRIDALTDEINKRRVEDGRATIVTMQKIQRANRLRSGKKDFVELLAETPKPPATAAELRPALLALDFTVTGYCLQTDSIWIQKPKKEESKKKATRKNEPIMFRITRLLSAIKAAVKRRRVSVKRKTLAKEDEPVASAIPQHPVVVEAENPMPSL